MLVVYIAVLRMHGHKNINIKSTVFTLHYIFMCFVEISKPKSNIPIHY